MGFFSAIKKFFGGTEEPARAEQALETSTPDVEQEETLIAAPDAADSPPQEHVKKKVTEEPRPHAQEAKPQSVKSTAATAEFAQTDAIESATPDLSQQDKSAPPQSAAPIAQPAQTAESVEQDGHVATDSAQPQTIPEQPAQTTANVEDAELLARLRLAEPKLSTWLGIILEDQEVADERFWHRLRFFLRSLEAPEPEIEKFASDFARWLETMEYAHIDEFRSELQYKLALALDLEDEEDERNRLVVKLSEGLAATRAQLGRGLDALFANHGELTDSFWEELEELFIMSDLGYDAATEVAKRLKRRAADKHITVAAEARALLAEELEEIFRQQRKISAANKPEVILMMGVNGAGKTTTIAKLAHRAQMEGKKTLIAAADTFRAAATEQLQVWADRAGAEFYSRPPGSDPASVAWEALDYAQKHDIDVVFIDTAGRLQTRVNLMEELGKIRQVLAKKHPGAPHRSMLVLDATTGQNALSQAKLFREAAGADEIVLTKLDGTSKGGVAIAVAMQEKLPITYIGLGEKMEDLRPFNGKDFALALLGET